MSRIQVTFLRSDGERFAIDDDTWGLTGSKGLDKPNVELYTEARASGDGSLVTASRIGERELTFDATIKKPYLNESQKRIATSFFLPGLTYNVYVQRESPMRAAYNCWLDSFEIRTKNQYQPISAEIGMICPDGYFQSVADDTVEHNINTLEPRLGYPIVFPPAGRITGIVYTSPRYVVQNTGDATAYVTITAVPSSAVTGLKAKFTKWTNGVPSLLGYIQYTGTIEAGQRLIIDGEKKTVTKNGVNVMNAISSASDLGAAECAKGDTVLTIEADTAMPPMDISVHFRRRYMGA